MKHEAAGALSYHVATVSDVDLEVAAIRVRVAELNDLESMVASGICSSLQA